MKSHETIITPTGLEPSQAVMVKGKKISMRRLANIMLMFGVMGAVMGYTLALAMVELIGKSPLRDLPPVIVCGFLLIWISNQSTSASVSGGESEKETNEKETE